VRLTNLLGVEVRTESGRKLGHAHDLRGDLTARTLEVTGVVVGGLGVLERLGLGTTRSAARLRSDDVVPWSAVVRADRRAIVVRDDVELG
jgi:sporulation protein YlmC with PRC-barrel domain